MTDLTNPAASPAMMTSREIAELTGKEHKNVLADIRKMLEELGKAAADFSAIAQIPGPNGSTRQIEIYNLPKRETLILVSGYSVEMRARIIDRWQELEAQAASAARSPAQMFLQSAQALYALEQQQNAIAAEVHKLEQRVEEVAESSVWDHCPQNCEPITKIRARMNKTYGLPGWVVDTVMRELPLSPKIAGMVRNNHEDAEGAHYAVWAVADITRVFKRFVGECRRETTAFATHPDIEGRFKLTAEISPPAARARDKAAA